MPGLGSQCHFQSPWTLPVYIFHHRINHKHAFMVTLNWPQQVFDLLSCIYIVFWSHILNMAELVLEEFNELLKEKLTLVVVVDIFEMCFIILFPVVCSVIGLVEVLDLLPAWPSVLVVLVASNPGRTQISACFLQGSTQTLVVLTVEIAIHSCYVGLFFWVVQVGVGGVTCFSHIVLPY